MKVLIVLDCVGDQINRYIVDMGRGEFEALKVVHGKILNHDDFTEVEQEAFDTLSWALAKNVLETDAAEMTERGVSTSYLCKWKDCILDKGDTDLKGVERMIMTGFIC